MNYLYSRETIIESVKQNIIEIQEEKEELKKEEMKDLSNNFDYEFLCGRLLSYERMLDMLTIQK